MPIRSDGASSISFTIHNEIHCLEISYENEHGLRIPLDRALWDNLSTMWGSQSYSPREFIERVANPVLQYLPDIPPHPIDFEQEYNCQFTLPRDGVTGQAVNPNTTGATTPYTTPATFRGYDANGHVVIDLGGETDTFTITTPLDTRGFFAEAMTRLFTENGNIRDQDSIDAEEFRKKYPEMHCAACENHIDQPQNMGEFLGKSELEAYIHYCKVESQKPLLYCCRCFGIVKRNPEALSLWKDIVTGSKEMLKILEILKNERRELTKAQNEILKERRKIIETNSKYMKHYDYLLSWMTEHRRNPLKLILASWSAFHYCRINPLKAPLQVTTKTLMEMIDADGQDPKWKGLGAESYLTKKFRPRWGRRYHSMHEAQIYRLRYSKFTIYLSNPTNEGITPRHKIVIPLPWVKNDHGFGFRVH